MAVAKTDTPSSGVSDWLLELVIGLVVIVLGGSVWAYSHYGHQNPLHQDKPRPVWLAIPKILAQMSDGRMVNVKVNLRLNSDKDAGTLEPHLPAFKALIQETGTRTTHEALQDREGVIRFGQAIRTSLNDYLADQDVPARVKDIAFDEMMLMP